MDFTMSNSKIAFTVRGNGQMSPSNQDLLRFCSEHAPGAIEENASGRMVVRLSKARPLSLTTAKGLVLSLTSSGSLSVQNQGKEVQEVLKPLLAKKERGDMISLSFKEGSLEKPAATVAEEWDI